MHIEAQSHLPIRSQAAFPLVCELDRWLPAVDQFVAGVDRNGPVVPGSQMIERIRLGRGERAYVLTVLDLDAPRSITFDIKAPVLKGTARVSFNDEGEGCRLRLSVDISPIGWGWLEWPRLWLFLRGAEQARLDGLARKLAAGEFAQFLQT
jgi:hypothetical protein